MATATNMGIVTFINHDKDYVTIEYEAGGKTRTINGNIGEKEQLKLKEAKLIKKLHHFYIGDTVSFILARSPRGDKMIADKIEFRFNNALDNLINKAGVENKFVGYLKRVDDEYFVKETGSYIFFPLVLSPWERKPAEDNLNDPIFFSLNNTDKPGKITATLSRSTYIPEYMAALKAFKNKTPVDATVFKITPHGIFVHVIGEKIQGKIPVAKDGTTTSTPKPGDTIKVLISYLGHTKIVVEQL